MLDANQDDSPSPSFLPQAGHWTGLDDPPPLPMVGWVGALPRYGNPHAAVRRTDVMRLDNNENTGPLPESVRDSLAAAVDERIGTQARISLYPDDACATEAVAAYAGNGFHGAGAWPGCGAVNTLLTNGCDQAIDVVLRAFCDPTTTVLTTTPTFPMYAQYLAATGARLETVPYEGDGTVFVHPAERLVERVAELGVAGERVVLVLTNPDPPTGTQVPSWTIDEVRRRNPAALVVVDETYFEFAPEGSMLPATNLDDHRVVFVRSLSKAFGLAGLRIGYVLGSAARVSGVATPAVRAEEHLRKIRGPYDLNELALVAAEATLADIAPTEAYVHDLMEVGRAATLGWLEAAGAEVCAGVGPFCLVRVSPDLPSLTPDDLLRAGVLVRPQPALPAAGRPGSWFRMTFPTSSELDRLASALAACGISTEGVSI